MTIHEDMDRTSPFVDRVNAAILENPLAAGLIGAGLAWMLFGGPKGFGAVAGRVGAAASTAGGAVTRGLAEAGSKVGTVARDAASEVLKSGASIVPEMPSTDKLSETGTEVSSALGEGFNSAAQKGREYGAAVRSKLSESLERQPLLLGAIGLAIGAGIASTFAPLAVENEFMGQQGAGARERVQGFVGEIKHRAGQVVSDVKDEAERQGLSATGVKKVAEDIGEKIKTVAGAGQSSLNQRFSN